MVPTDLVDPTDLVVPTDLVDLTLAPLRNEIELCGIYPLRFLHGRMT